MGKRKYKDKHMQKVYDAFMKVDPKVVRKSGAMDCEFLKGYTGSAMGGFVNRNSVAFAAYMAGKDARKRDDKGENSIIQEKVIYTMNFKSASDGKKVLMGISGKEIQEIQNAIFHVQTNTVQMVKLHNGGAIVDENCIRYLIDSGYFNELPF